MTTLHFSANSISTTKEITHGGRRYLVSPVIALREGVLNGILVEASEFSKYAAAWAGRPVPIGHPQAGGEYISANTPDLWAMEVPGHFWNVEADGDKLRGEIWIDLEKAQAIGERALRIVNRLRANQPVEVSTGYFADNDAVSGVWNGQPYIGIARHIRPDHLALLPDEIGACSWADGCGTPRVNTEQGGKSMEREQSEPCEQEVGLFEKFLSWMGQRKPDALIANGLVPNGQQEVETMLKQELIAGLTANQKCKFSQEKLQTWEEADLQALQESLAANEEEAVPEVAPQSPASVAILPAELTQFAEMIRGLGGVDKLAAALGGMTANADKERGDLISAIVANHKATWNEAELRAFDTRTLHKLYATALPRDYSGNGGYVRSSDPEEEELVMHWPVLESKV